jgi:CRISPR-associated protein Cas1
MSGHFALVVDRRGSVLEVGTHRTLVLRHADGSRERVGIGALASVVLYGDVQLSTGLLQDLAAEGVALTVLPLRGRTRAVGFTHLPHRHVLLRHRQHLAYADGATRLSLARLAVVAKCEAMASFSRAHPGSAKDGAYQAMHAAAQAPSLATLLGVEGASSQRHFALVAQAYGENGPFRFTHRNRLPPLDAPNALMSLCYTLAQSQAVQLSLRAGLDVQIGFLHGLQRDRQSLALDLLEPARAGLDEWVHDLLMRRRLLTPALFAGSAGEAVRLTREGRAAFYPLWFAEGCRLAEKPMRALLAKMLTILRVPADAADPEAAAV